MNGRKLSALLLLAVMFALSTMARAADNGGGQDDESKALDMRTSINSAETMKAILYYGVLGESLKSKNAKAIKDLMQRLLISGEKGMGRAEAVDTLRQNLPKSCR